jgi:hypothetical protein
VFPETAKVYAFAFAIDFPWLALKRSPAYGDARHDPMFVSHPWLWQSHFLHPFTRRRRTPDGDHVSASTASKKTSRRTSVLPPEKNARNPFVVTTRHASEDDLNKTVARAKDFDGTTTLIDNALRFRGHVPQGNHVYSGRQVRTSSHREHLSAAADGHIKSVRMLDSRTNRFALTRFSDDSRRLEAGSTIRCPDHARNWAGASAIYAASFGMALL